ncbi:antitoxin Xre-like helix-turn-helix domain-containing protein [Tepidicaulis sp. LMO-SS28]|uniref:antitoxin Xre-like helix-turn-helix domain-containing protein n=1 Tax=Tepidicaulis sp. LMO-SS28 TaxID=3447455 RepID=UPI003EE00D59
MCADSTRTQETDGRDLSGPGLRTFFRIAELWGLSVREKMTLLGISSRSTFYRWRKTLNISLPETTLQRISYVLAIYKALQILLPNEQAADRWIKEPNPSPLFAGKAPLDLVLAGRVSDLRIVWRYLDAQLNGGAQGRARKARAASRGSPSLVTGAVHMGKEDKIFCFQRR